MPRIALVLASLSLSALAFADETFIPGDIIPGAVVSPYTVPERANEQLLLTTTNALAWGDEGHETVVLIAVTLISDDVKSKVPDLLKDDNNAYRNERCCHR